ncbi:MAG: GTPase HflX [Planctomycetota bacterium]|jgi:GTP-binding protein HflX
MPPSKERTSLKVARENAVLASVHLPGSSFDPNDPLGELRALAESAGATPVAEIIQPRQTPEAATYMGKGKVEELATLCDATDASVVIFDHELSPAQIGNLEKILECKVIDRSELILDIFASRATTREAQLQVELAQLEYTYPRLRAMWSHLERIVGPGGIGGVGTRGPGEQQIELDRRIVQQRRTRLTRELAQIQSRKQRQVASRNLDHFTISLVGYTNAGKSTLFNALTTGGAYADDRLFATLVTRTRQWELGEGESAMLSDTVGFVRDLPHNLVASFKATLEEATHADLLLIVLDIADANAQLQFETVTKTLDELDAQTRKDALALGEPEPEPAPRLLVLNKADLLTNNAELLIWTSNHPDAITLSASDPSHPGIEALRASVRARAIGTIQRYTLRIDLADARSIALLERRATILDREYPDSSEIAGPPHAIFTVELGKRQLQQLMAAGMQATVICSDSVSSPTN